MWVKMDANDGINLIFSFFGELFSLLKEVLGIFVGVVKKGNDGRKGWR